MKTSDAFGKTIEDYLTGMADKDPLFAVKYRNPEKNIDDCLTYILNQVSNSGINGFTDDEIYSMAVHYYVEENIDPGKPLQCKVVVNHQVQLTEEEIAEQKRIAKERLASREMERLKSAHIPSARKTAAEENTGCLFPME